MRPIKIVAVSGSGRTGSTLLSLLLTQSQDCFNLGQLRDLWKSYTNNELCACGKELPACPIYSQAVPAIFGPDTAAHLAGMGDLMKTFFKEAARCRDWGDPAALQRLRQEHEQFIERLGRFLEVVCETTGTSSFVDTSKSPEMALALSLVQGVDLKVVNLVRDPRAVACSWHKKQRSIKAVIRFSRLWSARQRRLESWSRHQPGRFLRVRYEDFAGQPEAAVGRICEWAGLRQPADLFAAPGHAVVSWERQHLFPPANERLLAERKTRIEIAPTESWKAPAQWPIRCLALLFTFPAGWRYIRQRPLPD